MIPEECPFSNRQKLKLVLHGELEVCQGHQEKNDKGEFERVKCCNECPYFDKKLLNPYNPWSIPAIPYIPAQPPPYGKPLPIGPYTITWTDGNTTSGTENYNTPDADMGNHAYTYKVPYSQNTTYNKITDDRKYGNEYKAPFLYNDMV